jgi:hypothetical protein
MRAMRVGIAVSVLGILAAGALMYEPTEASARGGARAVAGARAVPGPRAAAFGHFRHRRPPVAVWVPYPWYDDYNDAALVPPDEQYIETAPSPDVNVIPRRLGCTKQTYKVPSEQGGTRNVAVVRC